MHECIIKSLVLRIEIEGKASAGRVYDTVITEMHRRNCTNAEVINNDNGISLMIYDSTSKREFIRDYKEEFKKMRDRLLQHPIDKDKNLEKNKQKSIDEKK